MRIIHKIKFATYEDAAISCGVAVDESVVPYDDPAREVKPLASFVYETKERYKSDLVQDIRSYDYDRLSKKPRTDEGPSHDFGGKPYDRSCEVSRFYIKKQVICGNTSQRLIGSDTPQESHAKNRATHKWMVYVRTPEYQLPLQSFVRKVRFFLHPSFAPNNIVEVSSPPFQITRTGWGEFPVRIQIHFIDSRNKPLNIIHQLQLCGNQKSGLQTLGGETTITVELDREFFREISCQDEVNRQKSEIYQEPPLSPSNQMSAPTLGPATESFLVAIATEKWPLISSTKAGNLPFACAKDSTEWESWSQAKRHSSEWQRARRMRTALEEQYQTKFTTLQMVKWCRAQHLTPPFILDDFETTYVVIPQQKRAEVLLSGSKKHVAKKIYNCKHCGSTHFPLSEFEKKQEECEIRFSQWLKGIDRTLQKFLAPRDGVILPDYRALINGTVQPNQIIEEPSKPLDPTDLDGEASPKSPSKPTQTFPTSEPKNSPGAGCPVPGPPPTVCHIVDQPTAEWIRTQLMDIDVVVNDETLEVESMLFKAFNLFAKSLVTGSLEMYHTQSTNEVQTEKQLKLLTPDHVLYATYNNPLFDFLTKKGLYCNGT